MEDVLDEYARPYDPCEPSICFDERPCQLPADAYPPESVKPGQVPRYDYEYERCGTCNLFLTFQPHTGWRHANVTAQRTKTHFAACMRELVDVHFPDAERIPVVLDNLNTHSFASLYDAFPPDEALRIRRKLVFHYTPKHASWLNMVEIELGVLVKQRLNRRLPDLHTLRAQVDAWQARRNTHHATVHWQFRLDAARTKLARLYA
jgi:hypothetical protein